jgi:hypothetical protein
MTGNSEIGDCGQPAMSKLGLSEIVDQLLRWRQSLWLQGVSTVFSKLAVDRCLANP